MINRDSLCRLKKKTMLQDSNHAFILGTLVYMVANSSFLTGPLTLEEQQHFRQKE
jgi:hypothetical protein